jgi:hypothetical protein
MFVPVHSQNGVAAVKKIYCAQQIRRRSEQGKSGHHERGSCRACGRNRAWDGSALRSGCDEGEIKNESAFLGEGGRERGVRDDVAGDLKL